RERMGRVRLLHALGWIRDVDEHVAAFDLHREGGHAVLLEAGLALAGATVEFPPVPRAFYVPGRIDAALAERAADVVAGVRDGAEYAVLERERDVRALHFHRPAGLFG